MIIMGSSEELCNMHEESVFTEKCDSRDLSNSERLMKFNEEKCRLLSFVSWPSHYPVSSSRLAKAGFYYTGKGDEVVCFSCNGHLSDWQYGAVVQKRHIESFPKCNFVNNKSNNVPLLNSKDFIKSESEPVLLKQISSVQNKNRKFEHFKTLTNSDKLDSNDDLNQVIDRIDKNSFISVDQSHFNFHKGKKCIKMLCETERLKTFSYGWPILSVSINLLSKAGFFYTGVKDKVQCAFCYGIVKNWQTGDDPITEHKRHFPFCEYIQKHKVISSETIDNECHQNITQELSFLMSCKLFNQAQLKTLDELGINMYKGPAYPDLATQTARLKSFSTWPQTSPVTKESLSAAGFFYIGVSDRTKCFHCGGGLHCWEKGDDPWVEHARWFQNCGFIHLNRGTTYISSVKNFMKSESGEKCNSALSNNYKIYKNNLQNGRDCDAEISSEQFEPTKSARQISTINCVTSSTAQSDYKAMSPAEFSLIKSVKNVDWLKETTGCQGVYQDCSSHKEDHIVNDDQGLCKVCMDNEVNVAFLPCGHVLSCNHCAAVLSECPTCCKAIQATVRVYLQ